MAAADVTITQDGGQSNVRVHPYLLALIRWCVSCVWSAGNVVLHRLLVASVPSLPGVPRQNKPRPANHDHLHPKPLVECQILHEPAVIEMDIIFVHGLYGSLSNTWRQGEWRTKYKSDPTKILLRESDNLLKKTTLSNITKIVNEKTSSNDKSTNNESIHNNNNYMKTVLPKELYLVKNIFNRNLLNQVEIIDNYETQARFVRDLFEYQNNFCDNLANNNISMENNKYIYKNEKEDIKQYNCICKINNGNCEVGCGCICDECYSSCWPRDWIKADYPNARVISINYTSDPHLWRPVWIKESKRLRLHERAEQMIQQLLTLGVGEKPIIWVGHSKGGLFIKQIYCEAYEAYLSLNGNLKQNININGKLKKNDIINHQENNENAVADKHEHNIVKGKCDIVLNGNIEIDLKASIDRAIEDSEQNKKSLILKDQNGDSSKAQREATNSLEKYSDYEKSTKVVEVQNTDLQSRSSLWSNSAGFMFYSVPHRGSPLADFKTPITARSIELMEICKDCSLVLALQERWLRATCARPRIPVRSLVETCRTLMSVLWLRIVSVDSADAGRGTLHGISLDHREICKPSSRHCLLYTELLDLIRTALNQHS